MSGRCGQRRQIPTISQTAGSTSGIKRVNKLCPLCREAGTADQHFLSACKYLPVPDRRYLTRARLIGRITDDLESDVQGLNTTLEEDMED